MHNKLKSIKLLAHGENIMWCTTWICVEANSFSYIFNYNNVINIINNVSNDISHFVCHKNLKELLEKLERNSELAINWFEDNYTKLHTGKCHLLISGRKYEHQRDQISKYIVWEENKVKGSNNRQ